MDEREKELVAMTLEGRTEVFAELIYPYRQTILRLAYRIMGDREEAGDVAQEACLLFCAGAGLSSMAWLSVSLPLCGSESLAADS